ncbi:unnamed protein product [Rotaria socialis]|uniref:Cadherin domain-containing protein n=1 Tax=Rotaria socialis TaxID=392032 RepID=A0A820SNJ7_9BILA|nr:unnamed protein product [Rotaria socialis]CAF3713428.1 unnamed protein product [Rotaria socialis]CAF4461079.1 unnamed protein product [Rotaria socialis]CAF4729050.1 unnamed protein product [Rotaria socialis]
MMIRIFILFNIYYISLTLSSRLKYRESVTENVELYHTITSLDKMISVNYQQSIEFLNINSPYTTYFLVDGQKLRTSRLIDREEFCRIKLCENSQCHPCEIYMDFVLKENGQPRDIISLILTIEDVNEYRPQFSDNSRNDQTIHLNISEGVPVGHILPIPSATDKDGEDDELVYWIDKNKKIPFELVSFGSNQIALNVTGPLDRELEDFYELQLTASDRENLTTTISVHISISDINDNVPIFDQVNPYIINISENTQPSLTKSLLRIHAFDNDSNDNSRITYNFSSQVSELIRQTFQLNSQTGELFLLQALDYEQYKEYRMPIKAQDSGPVSVPVYTLVIINIEDENDNKPVTNIRTSEYFQFNNNTLYISEETPINTLLMHVIVQDLDSNLNGKVQCWIESSDYLKLNITNALNNMFSIYTSQLFDREQQSTYSFHLIIEDFGLKIRHRVKHDLRLVINDINDNPPIFIQSYYNLTIEEEQDYEQALIRFEANDKDLNESSQITYELMSNEYKYLFYLNEDTGELFLREKLDREIKSHYDLIVRAHDHGKYPSQLHTDVICYIKILDKNEYKPEFEKEMYLFHGISETISINTSIGFVKAIDRDKNLIIYSISSSNFKIDSLTGEIFVNKQLDYDANDSCENLFVTAKNQDGLNSSCPVEICLQPINEYPPELHIESRLIYVNIDNTSFIHMHAFDRDRSPLSFLSFRLEKSSKCNLTCSSNGTIYMDKNEHCIGIIDLFVSIDDNDRYPSSKTTNETIRLVFYSNIISLQQILFSSNYKFTIEIIIITIILILIICIFCLIVYVVYRHRRQISLSKSTQLNNIKDQIGFTENHGLLNDGPVDVTNIKLKPNTNSDTSSSFNDSCYGSSETDVYHHLSGNKLAGKILISSNDKYIILCKDQNNINHDETNSSSSSSSPNGNNNSNLITRYQSNNRTGIVQAYHTQIKSPNQNLEFFQNNNELKKVTGSTATTTTTTTFNYRNNTPLNEYYL